MLLKAGAYVDVVHSADAALDLFGNDSYDAVFTDYVMEGKTGIELMSSIRERDSSIGVVLMTSHAAPDIGVEAKQQGANGFLRKPFKGDACVAAALEALNHRRAQQGLDLMLDS